MSKIYPIQHSFSAGEISPKLLARSDLPGYQFSAKTMLNMIPEVQGPATSRSGLKYLGQALTAVEQTCKYVPLEINFGESYLGIITTTTVYVANRYGLLPTENLVNDQNFSSGGDTGFWQTVVTGSASVSYPPGVCVLTAGAGESAAIRQGLALVTTPAGAHELRIYSLDGGPLRVMIGTAVGLSDIVDGVFYGKEIVIPFTPGVAVPWIQMEVSDGATKTLDYLVANLDSTRAPITFASVWDHQGIIEDLQYESPPRDPVVYIAHRDRALQALRYVDEDTWTFGPAVIIGAPWTAPKYPGSITFYKGRMYLGGTKDDPAGIWASEAGVFLNFTLGGTLAESPMYLPLDRKGAVQWLKGGKALFAGMDSGEHIIFGEGGAAPTPQNVDTDQQSAYGSSRVQPVLIGEELAYVTADRRRVYLTSYVRESLGYKSEDVSYPSEHLTKGLVQEFSLAVATSQNVWSHLADGTLIGMVYDPGRNIVGWHRHLTNGRIVSVTTIKNLGRDEVWAAVLRDGLLNFERFDVDREQMDSYVCELFGVPTFQMFGLDHLIGQTVQVLVDDAVHPDVVVAGDGSITVTVPGTYICAGLQFNPRVVTVPADMAIQSGSNTSFEKSWNKIFVRLIDSARPIINGIRPPTRNPESLMNDREPSVTEDVEVSNLGWDLDASITIEQDLPLSLSVSGIFGELDQENVS